jgi:hypothetical protein
MHVPMSNENGVYEQQQCVDIDITPAAWYGPQNIFALAIYILDQARDCLTDFKLNLRVDAAHSSRSIHTEDVYLL